MNEQLRPPSVDDIQAQRLGGLLVKHDDIEEVVAERAAQVVDEIDGIPFVDPHKKVSDAVRETEEAILSNKGRGI